MRTVITLVSLGLAGLAPFLAEPAALPVAHAPTHAAPADQDDPSPIRREAVAGSVHVLFGEGGNVGASVGDDGVLLVDAQFHYMVDGLLASVAELTDAPPSFLVNTHWHGDHVGGNARLGRAGAVIVAHDNVHGRMARDHVLAVDGRDVPAYPTEAQPVISYDERASLHLNGDTLRVHHVPRAHTDGDSIVHWEGADVVHMGDTFFNGFYPFIDPNSGGHIDGMVAAADLVLAFADEDTRIIPGHGPVGGVADLRAYRDMVATVSERLARHIADGKTDEQIVAAKPTADLDEVWGDGFLSPDRFVTIVLQGLRRNG